MATRDAAASADQHARLTWGEICARFPDQWVVVVDTDWARDTDLEFGRANVVAHHPRRKEASADVRVAFRSYDEVGCFWTGTVRAPLTQFVMP